MTHTPAADDPGGGNERTVWFVVAELHNPAGEPYVVLRSDTRERDELGGIEATVESLHWSREVANSVAEQLNRSIEGGLIS